ncbi:MAG: alkaline phosphatase PhoX [Bacteroidota bacterium]
MTKIYSLITMMILSVSMSFGQIDMSLYTEPVPAHDSATNRTIRMPQSPLKFQILFVGGVDRVQTTATYGNDAGETFAKEWNDFIGFTPATDSEDGLGWISVNHERIEVNDSLGDGGGMTVFKVERDPSTDTLVIVDQTLADGRSGQFFNVDFVNTVGETGMNCGGITSVVDGRIWTAEEWFRSSNTSIADRDTSDITIGTTFPSNYPFYDGIQLKKFENYNYMVEIDPREAVAIRKQYNWGKMGFEGGTVMPDNQTVYLGVDATPSFWTKFIADTPGDFTSGSLYVYKHDAADKWIEVSADTKTGFLSVPDQAVAAGATMYNRIEWVAVDTTSGKVYWTETGRDNPGGRWADENAEGAVHDPYTLQNAVRQGFSSPNDAGYHDWYGRIWAYDPAMDTNYVYIEGGPEFLTDTVSLDVYPEKHLSNPDGLNVMMIGNQSYLVINEDLNGRTHGRVPQDITNNRNCELYLLDTSIPNPTTEDLIYVTSAVIGAEITGACPTPDGKTLLVNSQHPSSTNPFPYNHSLTFAIHGWDKVDAIATSIRDLDNAPEFSIYPNPVARQLHFSEQIDAELLTIDGRRVRVVRESKTMDVTDLTAGTYLLRDLNGPTVWRVVIE